ncbi:MAG: hypothetical protein JWR55_628, partial [Aeromicrobium sp.]|nr:hypothetical protein [Aeromicrobium sp.]
ETPAAAPVAPEQAPEPTVVVPAQPAYEQPAFEQPTTQQPAASSEPTAVFAAPAVAPAPTATQAFGALPPAGTATPATAAGDGEGRGGRNLAIVIAMVAVVLALIATAAWGANEVLGGDDDSPSASSSQSDDDGSANEIDPPEIDDAPDPVEPSSSIPDTDEADDAPVASGEFCSTYQDIMDTSTDMLDTEDGLEGMQEASKEIAAKHEALKDSAPAELAADVDVMASYFELLENPDADTASKMSDMISDYSKAAQNVSVHYYTNCL